MSPGTAQVYVYAFNGDSLKKQVRIRPGSATNCTFELYGDPIEVDVIPANGATLSEDGTLVVEHLDDSGEQQQDAHLLPKSGHIFLENVHSNRFVLQAIDPVKGLLATRSFELPAGEPRRVTFELQPTEQRFRVLKPDRTPIAGALLVLKGAPNSVRWSQTCATDDAGEASVADLGPGDVSVSVFHVDHGSLPCESLSTDGQRNGTIDVMIPHGAETDLELRDGPEPLGGVEVEINDECGATMLIGRHIGGNRRNRASQACRTRRLPHPDRSPGNLAHDAAHHRRLDAGDAYRAATAAWVGACAGAIRSREPDRGRDG
ncbi:MAG: carboxypeptidase regulatory-like domain-containing protein [Planctomycetes bacterium]|nr:carboxypeptidase regulatory-like domain-containing protein [Planctomycetota bacterium]